MNLNVTRYLGFLIILLGLVSTTIVTFYVHRKNQKEDELRFAYETNVLVRRIQNRMQTYEGSLIEVRAFLKNSPTFHRKNLQRFIRDTQIFERIPGLQGLGFTLMINSKNVKVHEKVMRTIFPNYQVFPKGQRELYSAIIVLEPEDRRNKKAFGFDMYSDLIRRKAMQEARDSGKAIMSNRVILVQEDLQDKKLGFNLYLPFYKRDIDISTIQGRRNGLVGFVYSPFRASELFSAIFSDIKMVLDIEIYDGELSQNAMYFDYSKNVPKSDLDAVQTIILNGKKLIIKTAPLPVFTRASSALKTVLVFILGTFTTTLFFFFYHITRRQTKVVSEMAEQKEKLLLKEKEHVVARDDFLSIASHELKTPLTSLKLQAQVMLRSINREDPVVFTPEKVTAFVKQIDSQTTRLTRLVDDMLDISRIRTGRLKIEKDTVNLSEMIHGVIERLRPQFIKNGGSEPETELDNSIEGIWDRFRLEQVLNNLLTNAIRYGKGKPVKVKTEVKNNRALIYVIDQGIGIAEENSEIIFKRFERAGISASEVSGLGLGLFISNQIIKAHGGEIKVESDLGKGSTFIVDLPLT